MSFLGRASAWKCAGLAAALVLAGMAGPLRAACTDIAAPGVDWRRCNQDGRSFAGQNLHGAVLRDASFAFADLSGADLSGVEAYHGKFLSANLAGAKLAGASLSEADFTRANLTGASLAGADLRGAHFFRAV